MFKVKNIIHYIKGFLYRKDSFRDFLNSWEIFDYIYLHNIQKHLLKKIKESFKHKSEEDQKWNTIWILWKWGEGKTTTIEYIKRKYNKREYNLYEIDLWNGFSNLNNRWNDRIWLIKYLFTHIIQQYQEKYQNYLRKRNPISNITFLKNNLYNDIHIKNHYHFNTWIILLSFVSSIYIFQQNTWFSDYIIKIYNTFPKVWDNIFWSLMGYTLIKNIILSILTMSIFGTIFKILFIFIEQVLKKAHITKIYKRQIDELNLAYEFKQTLNNTHFTKYNKKNIIILENIDRLHPDQVLEVLDLTKTILEFDNTTYIIPIDPYLIYQWLQNRYKKNTIETVFNPIDYIDKIINHPLFVINPYIEDLERRIEDIENFSLLENNEDTGNKDENTDNKDYSHIGFSDKFIRWIVSNFNPRKERIFRDILDLYANIYEQGRDYYDKNESNKDNSTEWFAKNETYQKLFLCFLSLRYTDFWLYNNIENNMWILKKFLEHKKRDRKGHSLSEKELEIIWLTEREYLILNAIFDNFYWKDNEEYKYISCLSEIELYQYTRRVFVPLNKETHEKIKNEWKKEK